MEELLESPHKLLQLNHSLVLDILHEMQFEFRECLTITSKFKQVATKISPGIANEGTKLQNKQKLTFLQKTLAVWERGGRVAARIDWAMLKRNSFQTLVIRLVQYNDKIESFDRGALDDLRVMQAQHNLTLLQVMDKVDRVQELIEAMEVARSDSINNSELASSFRTLTVNKPFDKTNKSVVSLAEFKMHHMRIEMNVSSSYALYIKSGDLVLDGVPKHIGRQTGSLRGQRVWLEWRETLDDAFFQNAYRSTVEKRVMKLSAILAAQDKPSVFHSPKCVGYHRSEKRNTPRYALVYEWPPNVDGDDAELVSLRELLAKMRAPPPLNTRIRIANILAGSLLYLHAVDWIHKDIQSDCLLFAANPDRTINLREPILSGFEFSRPALPEEVTTSHQFSERHDLYRHPDLLLLNDSRSKKSHDIYSLGLVLAEIALWKPIETIAGVEVRRRELMLVRERMLQSSVSDTIAERVGWTYADLVQDCIEGGQALDILPEQNEEDLDVGVRLSNALHKKVVRKLESIKL